MRRHCLPQTFLGCTNGEGKKQNVCKKNEKHCLLLGNKEENGFRNKCTFSLCAQTAKQLRKYVSAIYVSAQWSTIFPPQGPSIAYCRLAVCDCRSLDC